MLNKKLKTDFLRLGLLTLILSAIFFIALNNDAVLAFQDPGKWGQDKDPYDMRSPEPDKYPWFLRQIPLVYYNPNDLDVDGNLRNAVWGWADTFSGPGLGENDPVKGRSGDTVTFVQLNPAAKPVNSGLQEIFIPVHGAKTIMSDVISANNKIFQGYPNLAKLHDTVIFNNIVRSQVPGMYKPSNPAMKVGVPMPENVNQIPVGINQELFNELKKTYIEYEAADGNKYLRLGVVKPDNDGPPRASLFHTTSYTVQVKGTDGTIKVKPVYELTADEINRGAVIGSYTKDNAAEAAAQPPFWDENQAKPSKGFYRATQPSTVYYPSIKKNVAVEKWHPNLMLGEEQEVPGEISAIAEIASDIAVSAPTVIKGEPGQAVQIPVKVTNKSTGYVATTLAYRIHQLVGEPAGDPTWQPYDTWQKGNTGKTFGLGSWGEFAVNIPETIKDKPVLVEVMANHLGKYPYFESDWENNVAFVVLEPEVPNLRVQMLNSPQGAYAGSPVTVSARVINDTGKLLTTKLVWKVNGKVVQTNTKFDVIGQQDTKLTFTMPSGDAKVEAIINPDRNLPANESNWNDNTAAATVKHLQLPPDSGGTITVKISAPAQVEPNTAWSYKVTVEYNWTRPKGYTGPPPEKRVTLTDTGAGKQSQGYSWSTGMNLNVQPVNVSHSKTFTISGDSSKSFTYTFPASFMINEGYYVVLNASLNTGAKASAKVYVKPYPVDKPGVQLVQ